jgi:hypothetical protein
MKRAAGLLAMAAILPSCGSVAPKGEWFGLRIEPDPATAALVEVSLVSSAPGVAAIEEVYRSFQYPPQP